jgi:hypothetical protein
LTDSSCWIEKLDNPPKTNEINGRPDGDVVRWLGPAPNNQHYWLPIVVEWAKSIPLDIYWVDNASMCVSVTPNELARFYDFVFGSHDGLKTIPEFETDIGATYVIVAEEF